MADFCKQCSIKEFGTDFRDLAFNDAPDSTCRYVVLCEGCSLPDTWATIVNPDGQCVVDCTSHHGTETTENIGCIHSEQPLWV